MFTSSISPTTVVYRSTLHNMVRSISRCCLARRGRVVRLARQLKAVFRRSVLKLVNCVQNRGRRMVDCLKVTRFSPTNLRVFVAWKPRLSKQHPYKFTKSDEPSYKQVTMFDVAVICDDQLASRYRISVIAHLSESNAELRDVRVVPYFLAMRFQRPFAPLGPRTYLG